jgi:hypothetical protein
MYCVKPITTGNLVIAEATFDTIIATAGIYHIIPIPPVEIVILSKSMNSVIA